VNGNKIKQEREGGKSMINYKLLEGVNACERGLLWFKENYGLKE